MGPRGLQRVNALSCAGPAALWLTAAGPTLDAGAYVVGLEYATGTVATVVGKPSREFFVRVQEYLGTMSA